MLKCTVENTGPAFNSNIYLRILQPEISSTGTRNHFSFDLT